MSDKELIIINKGIRRILSIAHSEKLDTYLNDVIKTDARKKMWIAINGKNMAFELSQIGNVSLMAVSYFLKILTNAGLIEYEQGKAPIKIISHVPSDWLSLLED